MRRFSNYYSLKSQHTILLFLSSCSALFTSEVGHNHVKLFVFCCLQTIYVHCLTFPIYKTCLLSEPLQFLVTINSGPDQSKDDFLNITSNKSLSTHPISKSSRSKMAFQRKSQPIPIECQKPMMLFPIYKACRTF